MDSGDELSEAKPRYPLTETTEICREPGINSLHKQNNLSISHGGSSVRSRLAIHDMDEGIALE